MPKFIPSVCPGGLNWKATPESELELEWRS